MDEVITLKARVYDLLAQKQRLEEELMKTNQQIIELQKEKKAE